MNLQFNIQNSTLKIAKAAVFLASLTPLYCLAYFAFTDNLGANPIEVITHWTGDSTIIFLLITLTVTPLRKISGWNDAVKFRRLLGLFAFFYACLHFTTYIWLDQFFDVHSMVKDVAKRPFITVGFASFVLLIPLALTSTTAMVRRLGKRWQRLHRLFYFAAPRGGCYTLGAVGKKTHPLAARVRRRPGAAPRFPRRDPLERPPALASLRSG